MQPGRYGLDRHVRIDETAFDFGNGLLVYQLFRGREHVLAAEFVEVSERYFTRKAWDVLSMEMLRS